mgnify:CR=1 FL=1
MIIGGLELSLLSVKQESHANLVGLPLARFQRIAIPVTAKIVAVVPHVCAQVWVAADELGFVFQLTESVCLQTRHSRSDLLDC